MEHRAKSGRWLVWLAMAVWVAGSLGQVRAGRVEMDLSGAWQYQNAGQASTPAASPWQAVQVPGFRQGATNYEKSWFKRTFDAPASLAGQRLKLRFGGAKFDCQAWVNGTKVGRYLNGYEPFEFDVTDAVKPGQSNELLVHLTDWTAVFSQPVDFSTLAPYENPRDHAVNALRAPIGGHYYLYGLWQPVTLLAVPEVYVSDVFAMPSVRQGELRLRLAVCNEGATPQTLTLDNRVLDGQSPALVFPSQQVTVAAGDATQVELAMPWPDAHRWSHLDPYLYQLETTLGGAGDTVRTRFGFRELWREGDRLLLNGTPINLLAAATWPQGRLNTEAEIRKVLLDAKAAHNVAIRLHTQPWDEPWYTLADELGMMIVEEGAVWCDARSYRVSDPVFWANFKQHWTGAIRRDRNHPSVVMWSIENELLHCGAAQVDKTTEASLADVGRHVKALDPTRPITYEADLDPGGVADVIGLHYPHEYPDFAVWPNAAYWLDSATVPRDWVPGGQWSWAHDKPLYLGEFLWVPSTSADAFTILFGDEVFSDPAYYRNLAKGITWRMQIEAYRRYGVNGICPWTVFEDPAVTSGTFDLAPDKNYLLQQQKAAYEPNAVFLHDYSQRVFAGEPVQRALQIHNDTPTGGGLNLEWRVGGNAAWQSAPCVLSPAGQTQMVATFTAPASVGPFNLEVQVTRGEATVFTNAFPLEACARTRLSLPAGVAVGLYNPQTWAQSLFASPHLPFVTVTNLRTAPYEQLQALVVGPGALTEDTLPEVGPDMLAAQWEAFMQRGGRILVLEQNVYPRWMPFGAALESFEASYAFPDPAHPVTADLTPENLRWWADGHGVVGRALRAPTQGNFRWLARVGSTRGLEYAAAVEWSLGRGGMIGSQWALTTRFDTEPMAGLLLQRLLNYAASPAFGLHLGPAGTLADGPATARLRDLGLLSEDLSGRLPELDPQRHPVLVVAGGTNLWQQARTNLSALASYVDRGGRLWLHQPPETFLTSARASLLPGVEWSANATRPVLGRGDPTTLARVASGDLYWIEQAGSWDRPEILSSNIAARVYRKRFNLTSYRTLNTGNMPIHTAGAAISGGWCLFSNGQVAQDVEITQPGTYLFSVTAYGTPALGEYPLMSLRIDDRVQDAVAVAASTSQAFTLTADLTAGTHRLALSFDNDAYNPPEDRNLFLQTLRYGLDTGTGSVQLLTHPGAIAQVKRGQGVVLLDDVAWDTETRNARKAERVASTLLTSLGAAAHLPPALLLEAESMSNVNVAAYSTGNGLAYVSSGGTIETPVRFTTTGDYTFELLASGTPAAGVWPLVGIQLDGVTKTNLSVTTSGLARYTVTLRVTAGRRRVGLFFANDLYAPPEDRNVAFDRVTIRPEAPPRVAELKVDTRQATAALSWEAQPGRSYAVEVTPGLTAPAWQTADTVTSVGNIASWVGPVDAAADSRFYRIRTVK